MRLTYTIQVCNESRELFSLLNFLSKTIDEEDEINVVADSNNVTDKVEHVLDHFKERINVFKRPFDQFHTNAQFHIEKATGDYIFGVDADEMPQEILIKNIKKIIKDSGAEIIAVPRINIHPGATQEFIEKSKFNVNDVGFINWPDFRCVSIKDVITSNGLMKYTRNSQELIKSSVFKPTQNWLSGTSNRSKNRKVGGQMVVNLKHLRVGYTTY